MRIYIPLIKPQGNKNSKSKNERDIFFSNSSSTFSDITYALDAHKISVLYFYYQTILNSLFHFCFSKFKKISNS